MKSLKRILRKKSGRSKGKVTVRHQGGREKRFLREIDWKRNKDGIWGKVTTIEYDPNRNSRIALIVYQDGDKKFILAPDGLKVGQKITSGEFAPLEVGNTLPLSKIAVGTPIHNIEITPGKGAQIVRGAGSVALLQGREEAWVLVKMPSAEIRRFVPTARATVGQVGNVAHKTRKLRKAGTKRHMGIRPTVRGVAMHPNSHPHGGGEGRSGVGMKAPKTPWGKSAVGKTRAKKKYSDKLIVAGRKRGPHAGGKGQSRGGTK
ncbi:50S ribosomal protein L2 [Candidatus Microgenomates bacterium]|nr:50S ribosomal protein L2 [Candidatus Microgenomates bacterium]